MDVSPGDPVGGTRSIVEGNLPGARGTLDFRSRGAPIDFVEAARAEKPMILRCRTPFGIVTADIEFDLSLVGQLLEEADEKRIMAIPFTVGARTEFAPTLRASQSGYVLFEEDERT
jgi:hypothetical protein